MPAPAPSGCPYCSTQTFVNERGECMKCGRVPPQDPKTPKAALDLALRRASVARESANAAAVWVCRAAELLAVDEQEDDAWAIVFLSTYAGDELATTRAFAEAKTELLAKMRSLRGAKGGDGG